MLLCVAYHLASKLPEVAMLEILQGSEIVKHRHGQSIVLFPAPHSSKEKKYIFALHSVPSNKLIKYFFPPQLEDKLRISKVVGN